MNRTEVIPAGQGASLTMTERDVGPSMAPAPPNVHPTAQAAPQAETVAQLQAQLKKAIDDLATSNAPVPEIPKAVKELASVLNELETTEPPKIVEFVDAAPIPGSPQMKPHDIQNLQRENATLQNSLGDAGASITRIGGELHTLKGEHSRLIEAHHAVTAELAEAKATPPPGVDNGAAALMQQNAMLKLCLGTQSALVAMLIGPKGPTE